MPLKIVFEIEGDNSVHETIDVFVTAKNISSHGV